MTVAEYIIHELIGYGVTDAFGIPGGVILHILYAMQSRAKEIHPHLNYHEQMAGFAACGYAQAGGRLGVAYATREPGITNMITCIAEAYQESLPVLFLTAHNLVNEQKIHFQTDQEIDFTESVSRFTKYSKKIELVEELPHILMKACDCALSGRKGPVFLDLSAAMLGRNIQYRGINNLPTQNQAEPNLHEYEVTFKVIMEKISNSNRPVILIGDGLRQVRDQELIKKVFCSIGVPILSSRAAQDLLNQSNLYFGYIGSHGTRYSNFILSKADLIVSIGNRLAFPTDSKSFVPIINHAKIVRIDIDEKAFFRIIPNAVNFCIDLKEFVSYCSKQKVALECKNVWITICKDIKNKLDYYDITVPVKKIMKYLEREEAGKTYVCDVGNNEFWFARAYEKVRPVGNVLYSKAYGTLGAALGRAIGAYYATKQEVVCVVGDQGFQYNIQELQYIAYWNIPIKIILLNNICSEMILDHEQRLFGNKLVHVTEETGYSIPDFKQIVEAYKIKYLSELDAERNEWPSAPFVYEIFYEREEGLVPYLPKGYACQKMFPALDENLDNYLDKL